MAKLSKTQREQLKQDLRGEDTTKAMAAVEKVKKQGDAELMSTILDALTASSDAGLESALAQLLFDLKDKDAIERVVDELTNSRYTNIRVLMLSACWQSGHDLSHRLSDLLTAATIGTYMECLEVLTVIENWDTIPDRELLEVEIIRMKTFVQESDAPEKDELIFSIIEVLENLSHNK